MTILALDVGNTRLKWAVYEAPRPGARLLAVVDAFDAMTRSRAHRQHPRPLLRAVAEINSLAGRQFDAYWVGVFNTWIREYLVGPRGCEVTGITETADGRTLFVNIQHPGENTPALGTNPGDHAVKYVVMPMRI